MPGTFRNGRAILAFVVVAPLAFPLLCVLYMTAFPPVTPDGLHVVMPVAQVFFAFLGSAALGGAAGYAVGRRP